MGDFFDKLFRFEQINTLIRLKATGAPKVFAGKLGVSERSLKRIIQQLRDAGFPIAYDHNRQTYFYEQEVKFLFQLQIDGKEEFSIKGGKNLVEGQNLALLPYIFNMNNLLGGNLQALSFNEENLKSC